MYARVRPHDSIPPSDPAVEDALAVLVVALLAVFVPTSTVHLITGVHATAAGVVP